MVFESICEQIFPQHKDRSTIPKKDVIIRESHTTVYQ